MSRTPGPWRVDRGNTIYAGGFKIGQTGGDYYDNGRADKSGFCVGLPTEINAAFIVKACNAHDALVSALHATLALLNDPDAGEDEATALERVVRIALAQA
jgi:hypothetical protein